MLDFTPQTDSRALARELASTLALRKRSWWPAGSGMKVLGEIERRSKFGDVPHCACVAAVGIAWTVMTARCDGQVENAIRRQLSARQVVDLVAELAVTPDLTIGDAPRFINGQLARIVKLAEEA